MKIEIGFCPQCGERVYLNRPHFCPNPVVKKSSGFSFGFRINLTNLWRRWKKKEGGEAQWNGS